MIATLTQDVMNVIENFKSKVNPEFVASPSDITKIKTLITECSGGRSNSNGGDILYTYIDYDGLKRHNIKDFSFSLKDYERWSVETLELLKADAIARRNKRVERKANDIIQLPA